MEKATARIGIIGAESTGKTWLTERLAAQYRSPWVPEAARSYFSRRSIDTCTLADLEEILRLQLASEASYPGASLLFCDTTPLTIHIWALLEFGASTPFITEALNKTHYDLYLLCDNSIPWEKDPLRFNVHSRDLILDMNRTELERLQQEWRLITGVDITRLKTAIAAVEEGLARLPKR